MARPKSKEKKPPLSSSKEEPGSGGEDSVPSQRKRGRPRKVVKDEIESEELKEVGSLNKKVQMNSVEVGKKRKRQKKLDDSADSVADKNGDVNGVSFDGHSKPTIVKREGNRRKGKPIRAAGAFLDGK